MARRINYEKDKRQHMPKEPYAPPRKDKAFRSKVPVLCFSCKEMKDASEIARWGTNKWGKPWQLCLLCHEGWMIQRRMDNDWDQRSHRG